MSFEEIQITVTNDYEKLVELFIKNDLEFSVNDEVPTDLIKLWKAQKIIENKDQCNSYIAFLIGGCVLAKRQGEYIIDGIAVEPEYRKSKLGKSLLEKAIDEVKKLGGKQLFLVARAPEFFRKQGFVTVERNDAPNFFECLTCPQYGKDCFPEVMKLEIK
ncbi:GNAT family N-acetyltransferase [Anaerovorax odorimutans]|uniref:GNAT family N-acetyltransferase n=1 Tax=Anaerovorax odorimutans TaxID=109327 RepID=UPI00040BBE4F|nr:GNAT family N-acetyltransferase [Anaerovorax odorimutans]